MHSSLVVGLHCTSHIGSNMVGPILAEETGKVKESMSRNIERFCVNWNT